jgi:hypothetical protein
VSFATRGAKSALMRPRSTAGVWSQIVGSATPRRIQIVKSAGRTPTKNTPRQPQIGSTIRLTSAARP